MTIDERYVNTTMNASMKVVPPGVLKAREEEARDLVIAVVA